MSIILIVLAAAGIIISICSLASGGLANFMSSSPDLSSITTDAGDPITPQDAQTLGKAFIFSGIIVLISSIIMLITGIFGLKASKDSSKIGKAYAMGFIFFIVEMFSVCYSSTQVSNGGSIVTDIIRSLISLLIPATGIRDKSQKRKITAKEARLSRAS